MRWILSLAVLGRLSAASLTVSPETVYDCTGDVGSVTLAWSGASGDVRVIVGSINGPALNDWDRPSGTASTGNWVRDGMLFYLVNRAGNVEASSRARVRCGGTPNTLEDGMRNGSYFPLEVGNTWIYRFRSRMIALQYEVRSITGTVVVGNQNYYVLSIDGTPRFYLRTDAQKRVWSMPAGGGAETLLLDPMQLQMVTFVSPLGTFTDAALATVPGLQSDDLTYVRGIGLAKTETILHTGSSGGFVQGLDLVEVRLAGGVRISTPAPLIALVMEAVSFDVTGKKVTNCILPCYSVACFGGDSPGTYKPCAQARVDTRGSGEYTVQLQLLNASGEAVFQTTPARASGDYVSYLQVPFYAKPNEPVPPGNYKLAAKLVANGDVRASAEISIRID